MCSCEGIGPGGEKESQKKDASQLVPESAQAQTALVG